MINATSRPLTRRMESQVGPYTIPSPSQHGSHLEEILQQIVERARRQIMSRARERESDVYSVYLPNLSR